MLLKQTTLRGIESGSIRLQFRYWKRPTVRAGGTLMTSVGQLRIEEVEVVERSSIREADALEAGFSGLDALLATLEGRASAQLYRVRLSYLGADPRLALREEMLSDAQILHTLDRLEHLDARSSTGGWTKSVLEAIRDRPSQLAAELAEGIGMDKARFKANVRKLKGMGLTESLTVGYRLSPRGKEVLRAWNQKA